MRLRDLFPAFFLVLSAVVAHAGAPEGDRLTYLDGDDPYSVGRDFPKLTTPQWVGEDGVEAVVVLAIDDMRDPGKYETFLRPILDRLKAIDGRAPVGIMTCQVKPDDPRLQGWIKEGLNFDVHTITHPCPLLQKGDFDAASKTVHDCTDLLSQVPGNRPVAFRMPCCDSLNTLSPRFFAEIFNRTSPGNHHLTIDSSVFHMFTPADPALPRDLVIDPDGGERFRKYLPFPSFVNTIENYPYPYVIGRLCWEFPCMVPSDWEAQNLYKPNNPKTVADLKAALDAVVLKQGVFNLVFHPHGWIKNTQIVELIDYAATKYGEKVKFLNFREAQERLDKNLLGGQPLRNAEGRDNGVRLLDVNHDGYMDVAKVVETNFEARIWEPRARSWRVERWGSNGLDLSTLRFACVGPDAWPWVLSGNGPTSMGSILDPGGRHELRPQEGDPLPGGLPADLRFRLSQRRQPASGPDQGLRFRDLDHDGTSELLVANDLQSLVLQWSKSDNRWNMLPFTLPEGAQFVDAHGRDAGLRFVDLDEDGDDDVVFSNDEHFGVYLFESMTKGWSRLVTAGKAGDAHALPKIVRDGTNNGFWVHSRQLWWQNEDTAKRPDLVDRRSFNELLKDVEPRAKSAEASRRSFRVRPGFRVELAASEPLITDPIAFDWAADGALWVVEMGDYPLGLDGKGKSGGVVRRLEDTDGDHRYDKATVFLDGLGFPTSVLPWRNGVLIGCAPDIIYAEDRDGDGRADHREVLFTGFHEGNPQHRMNGFELGLDGWIYGANGDSGGNIRSIKTGKTIDISHRDFRFRPDDGRFEPASGPTQYGRHRDDWGHWFGNNNPNWGWHYVLADDDLKRNPSFAPPDPRRTLEPDTKLYPLSRTLPRFNSPDAAGRVTSANSLTPYRDDLFGPHFADSVFISEPVHNLVHRMVLEPDGATFKGKRAVGESDREFLASTDNWTRPTMLKTGPDGALWVADMYRAVIEHPEWIPDDWEAKLDLRAGSDQGRIYRVLPVACTPRPFSRLDRLDTPGLVAALDSPNGWRRDTAHRLLLHRADPAAVEPLRRLVAETQRPKTRVQALWVLENLGALTPESVLIGLADPHPQVRRTAIQASAALLNRDGGELAGAMLRLVADPDAQVRLQLATSLGNWDDRRAGQALAALARRDADDPWLRAAVLSSATPHVGTVLAALLAETHDPPPTAIIEPLFALAGTRPDRGIVAALNQPAGQGGRYSSWQFAALAGLLDAADRARRPFSASEAKACAGLWESARGLVDNDRAPEDERLQAVRLLGRDAEHRNQDRDCLVHLLRPSVSPEVQAAAVAALARTDDPKVPEALLSGWKRYSPPVRDALLDALLSRPAWTASLLSSLEDTCVPPAEIGPAHRRRLLGLRDAPLRGRAEAIFARETGTRQTVVDAYRTALTTPGNPTIGKATFQKVCASCHKLDGVGFEVGPDLATLTDRSPEALLSAIIDPNRAFEAKFTNYTVATHDGRVLTGMIAGETANAVTLQRQEGKQDVLLRADIEEMIGSGQSLMPEGLEKDLKPPDVADLIAYLGTTGPPPKHIDGNKPEKLAPRADGVIVLPARSASLFGTSLTFEPQYGNLGYWTAPDDRASWSFDVPRPGRYAVWIDWACADDSAGNTFTLQTGNARIVSQVSGTGNWDTYRSARIGPVALEAGTNRLEIRAEGPIRGALIDLRTVELRPE